MKLYSFLVKGLRLSDVVIKKPLVYDKERWSGEKMILIPSLIDDSLDRAKIVETFAKPKTGRKFGTVALCPSFKGTKDWQNYGSDVADTNSIESKIANLKAGAVGQTIVVVNRYDGIDLPDSCCRILIMDSRPYSESILDRYLERCLGNSEFISAKTARKIEQGLGRSVRGEKDYCVIILTGPDLIKQIRNGIHDAAIPVDASSAAVCTRPANTGSFESCRSNVTNRCARSRTIGPPALPPHCTVLNCRCARDRD